VEKRTKLTEPQRIMKYYKWMKVNMEVPKDTRKRKGKKNI
jgi:hypothetical protein